MVNNIEEIANIFEKYFKLIPYIVYQLFTN